MIRPRCALCEHAEARYTVGGPASCVRLLCYVDRLAPVRTEPFRQCERFERAPGAEGDALQ